jgi:hypothetical protein
MPMMKVRNIAVIGVGLGACVIGAFFLFREGGLLHCWVERCYEGKPAGYWIKALQDKDPKTVDKAMDALYKIEPPSKEAASILLAMVEADPKPNEGHEELACPEYAAITLWPILRALGPDAREFIPRITKLLHSPGVFQRMRACRLLREMGKNGTDAIPALTEALNDEFPPVGKEAADALRHIDPEGNPKRMEKGGPARGGAAGSGKAPE